MIRKFPFPDKTRKATLVVKNIRRLYICNEGEAVLKDAYLACHHQWIIATGTGNGWEKLADDATRVLDCAGRTVIPAFVEPAFDMQAMARFHDTIRIEHNLFHDMRKAGILTVACLDGRIQYQSLEQDVFRTRKPGLPILEYGMRPGTGKFVLTCKGPGANTSLQPTAFHLFQMMHIPAYRILMAMTAWPAAACGLDDRGVLEAGKLADFLIVQAPDLEAFFARADTDRVCRMVKNGIPVWPEIIRC